MEHGIIFYSQPTVEIAALAVYASLVGSDLDFVCSSSPEDMRRVSPAERDALYGTVAQPVINLKTIPELHTDQSRTLIADERGVIPSKYMQRHNPKLRRNRK